MSTKKAKSAHDLFGTNKNLESGKGVTLEYPGFSIVIHRAGGSNKKYGQVLSEKMKPHRQRFERGLMDDETSEKILLEAFVEGVIVGWSGNIGPGGKKTEYSVENCMKVFQELPDLYLDVRNQAMNAATFREEMEKVEEKN
jgi:hypothetical protein